MSREEKSLRASTRRQAQGEGGPTAGLCHGQWNWPGGGEYHDDHDTKLANGRTICSGAWNLLWPVRASLSTAGNSS